MRLRQRLLLERIIVVSILIAFAIFIFAKTQTSELDELVSQEYVEIAKNVIPAVVSITALKDNTSISYGSGFTISSDGYIVTNNHVITDADRIQITLPNKDIYSAKITGIDAPTDIAVLKIKGKNLPMVSIGDSEKIKVGEKVVAIGNPYGLDSTITSGIVSAKHRDRGPTEFKDFIQTDASINPGNSGGPLVNLEGEVIGINTFIYSSVADEASDRTLISRGLGFAIPINLAKDVINSLIKDGFVYRSYLGVRVANVIDFNETLGYGKIIPGARVIDVVEKSPAFNAGIKVDDIVKKVNDIDIEDSNHLKNVIAWIKKGEQVDISIERTEDDKTEKIKVILTLEERPENY